MDGVGGGVHACCLLQRNVHGSDNLCNMFSTQGAMAQQHAVAKVDEWRQGVRRQDWLRC